MYTPRLFLAYPEQIYITVDVSTRVLTLTIRQQVHGSYPVAVGKLATPTPVGNWQIRVKTMYPSWEVLGTRWMGLNVPWGNYGMHGTNSPWSIGRYISNGCIRLYNHHAEEIFSLAPIGTPVNIIGKYPGYGYYSDTALRPGSQGPQVARLQRRLVELGFDPGPIDGVFGPMTEAALIAFQRQKGLPVDGIAGADTLRALGLQ